MFYIKEVYFRFLYVVFLVIFLFFIHYHYKQTLLILFLIPNQFFSHVLIEHFIYTHPTELLIALLNLNFFFIAVLTAPHIVWTVLDFMKPGLILTEYKKMLRLSTLFFFILLILNIFLFWAIFPLVFKFFQSFNSFELQNVIIKLELKIFEFIDFIYNIFWIINISLFFIFTLLLVVSINGVAFYIQYKKFFILFNIIAATFLSTPDIGSQLFLFIVLNILLETFQVFISLIIKISRASC